MSDARVQQLIAGFLATIALTGYIILRAIGVTETDDAVLGAVITLLVGFVIGSVKTNGVGGSKAVQASEDLAAKIAAKVVASTPQPKE